MISPVTGSIVFSVVAFLIGGRDMSSSRFSLDTIGLFGLTCDVRGQPETTPSTSTYPSRRHVSPPVLP